MSQETGYRIAYWRDYYEPPERDRPAGPLTYVRWYIYGHDLGESYRLLFLLAPSPAIAGAAFGLFAKLLELAADEPAEMRDGTIRWRGRPSTMKTLPVQTLYPAELLQQCLDLLCNPDVGWIETLTGDELNVANQAAAARPSLERRSNRARPSLERRLNHAGPPEERRAPGAHTNTKYETETDTDTKTRNFDIEASAEKPLSASVSTSASTTTPPEKPARQPESPAIETKPPTPTNGTARTAESARTAANASVAIAKLLNVKTTRDATTIHRAITHALSCAANAEDAARDLIGLANQVKTSASIRNPRAAWTAAVIRRYGDWSQRPPRRYANEPTDQIPGPANHRP